MIGSIINELTIGVAENFDLLDKYIPLPNALTPPSASRQPDWFPDAIGAIDGTHVAVSTYTHERPPYINRKGFPSQNVLAACNFDLEFIYVVPGWEGSAADSMLWDYARSTTLSIPEGKYYLGEFLKILFRLDSMFEM